MSARDMTTPRPWLVEHRTVYALTEDARGRLTNRFTAQVQGGGLRPASGPELIANARLIVAAVNNFDPLRKALRDILEAAGNPSPELLKRAERVLRETSDDR